MFGEALVIGIVITIVAVALAVTIAAILIARRRSDGRKGPTPPPPVD